MTSGKRVIKTVIVARGWRFWAPLLLAALVAFTALHVLVETATQTVLGLLTARLVPIYKVDRPDKVVSISFDATWGTDHTDELLAILEENNVKTTFFLAGFWVEKYPEYVAKIAAKGHDVENHSYSHPHMASLSKAAIRHELEKNHALIKNITGKDPFLFRPPFGEYSNTVIETAQELGYHTIQWSVDSLDWKDLSATTIVERILSRIGPGDIVLMHNNGKHTAEAVRRLLPELKRRGYEIVPISQLIYRSNFFIERHSGAQKALPPPREVQPPKPELEERKGS